MKFSWPTFFIVTVLILIISDLIFINYRLISMQNQTDAFSLKATENLASPSSSEVTPGISNQSQLEPDLIRTIEEATRSLSQKVVALESKQSPQQITQDTAAKEYYIPLGTGIVTAVDWTDIGGAEAYVVPANLGEISEMYFEASAYAQSGRIYVRLRNVTDNIGLFESEISLESSTPTLVSSGKIPVPKVTKLYRVQMKSALGVPGTLTNARIKLFIK